LIRAKRVRQGHLVQRLLSRSQAIYPRLEAKGLRAAAGHTTPVVERDPGIDAMFISEGSAILIQCKSARKEVETEFRRLSEATRMAGRSRWPVDVLPDAVIGVRDHALVEVLRRERYDDAPRTEVGRAGTPFPGCALTCRYYLRQGLNRPGLRV
jgi:hypothetical protein